MDQCHLPSCCAAQINYQIIQNVFEIKTLIHSTDISSLATTPRTVLGGGSTKIKLAWLLPMTRCGHSEMIPVFMSQSTVFAPSLSMQVAGLSGAGVY